MDLKAQILREHSKANCMAITKYVGSNPKRFGELVKVYIAGPYRVTQRAAWPLSCCIEDHPTLIEPHLKKILDFVTMPDAPVAVKRNTVRLLQFIEVPKKFQGRVTEICFNFLNDKKETVAVQVFAMTALSNIAKHQPELANELRVIIEDRLPYASAGFKSRGVKTLKILVNAGKKHLHR